MSPSSYHSVELSTDRLDLALAGVKGGTNEVSEAPQSPRAEEAALPRLLGSKTVISKSTAKIIILANSLRKTSRKKDQKNTNTYGRGSPERSVRKETGQDPRAGPFSQGHLAHGRGRPALRSPRPWARTTSTTVTSPMGEDDQHHGHLAHGRGRPSLRSPRPWARTTSTTVTSPMGEDDHHQGHLAHGRGRPAPRSPRPWARTIHARLTSPQGEDNPIPASPTRFDSRVLHIVVISDFWIIYLSFRLDRSFSRSFTTKIVEKPEGLKTAQEDLNVSRGRSTI
ncbi:hypothetical protein DY000_02030964 [Brassica cretica]|uniref:Uncharacterized protein n=1 Tax=Brassica cretica TaxID=69181 RepID=A0ABQ7DZS1_BRACR|nr:hypothetical protein DY000_02030964 [Brassica cretica]